MGITTLQSLENVIPSNFLEVGSRHIPPDMNFTGLLRTVMMIHDIDRYFKNAWKEHWRLWGANSRGILHEFGIELSEYVKKHKLTFRS
jgi:isochorismate hydrolase